jgi:Skp family chaperone for outer membrane proteins
MRRKNDLNSFYKEANELLQKREEELLENTKKEILDVIKSIAVHQGISLVFSKEQVLYAQDAYTNITEEVIKKLNEVTE